jgi:transcriptional regulator with XRE-family HTH domain
MELRIKEVLKEKSITTVYLADKIGMTRPNMSNIVNSKVNPSIETLQRIADVLEVEITELFKPSSDFYGVVIFKGKTFKIDSETAFLRLYNEYVEVLQA